MAGMYSVRPERAGDAAAIRAVHCAAFPSDAESRLVEALREHGKMLVSLVAEAGGRIVGHVAFSPVTVEVSPAGCEGPCAGLAPLAVIPEWQRRGIGAALAEEGVARCRARGISLVVVLGEPAYYGRLGFQEAGRCGLLNEYGAGPEFMVLDLRAGATAKYRGMVRYAEEFRSVE